MSDAQVRTFIGTLAGMPTNRLRLPAPEDAAFAAWLVEFNRLIGKRWPGATLFDVADRPWRDWFEIDGDTPEQAVA